MGRRFVVDIVFFRDVISSLSDGVLSQPLSVNAGVPHDSILPSALFRQFTSDLTATSNPPQFVEDFTIHCTVSRFTTFQATANLGYDLNVLSAPYASDLGQLFTWDSTNHIYFSASETSHLFHCFVPYLDFDLNSHCAIESLRLLGLSVNYYLYWPRMCQRFPCAAYIFGFPFHARHFFTPTHHLCKVSICPALLLSCVGLRFIYFSFSRSCSVGQ